MSGNAISTQFHINHFSDEIMLMCFSYLSPKDLGLASGVCKRWNHLGKDTVLWNAIDLKQHFPKLEIIDENFWKNYVQLDKFELDVSDIAPLNNREIIPLLYKFPYSQIEADEGMTILTMPRGLFSRKLQRVAKALAKANEPIFEIISHNIELDLKNYVIEKTRRVLISNSVINGSRNKSALDQVKLIHKFKCQIPGALEITTLLVMTYFFSKKRLYNDSPFTHSLASKPFDVTTFAMIGNFSSKGIQVNKAPNFSSRSYGAGAQLDLP
jgi:hypothetical protein